MLTSSTIFCLLEVVGGQKTKDNGDVTGSIQTRNALCDTLTDIVEMRCLSTDDAAEDDNGIITVVECHLVSTVDEFKRTRYGLHMDILR